ncbi:MAG: hypothetical protein DRG20_02535 [Deltaproteobacteria bacterium]|nr:hypothetical protein [Deltaproteobacteria bacterium]RLA90939.1 MAG: hypothetical protein DRG20_02535 [Deltaproteobacteria bacterium]
MKKKFTTIVVIFAIAFLFGIGNIILAQTEPLPPAGEKGIAPPPRPYRQAPFRKFKRSKERISKKIELIKMWRLIDELNLDEETAVKLFPKLKDIEKKRQELEQKKRKILFSIRRELREKNPNPQKLSTLITEFRKNRMELANFLNRSVDKLDGILTVEQQAKYILFIQEFPREIKRILQEARRGERTYRRRFLPPERRRERP